MLKTMFITNSPEVAKIAEAAGVDRIWIDLEINSKSERQKGRDTVISSHKISDIPKVKAVLSKAEMLVRINPINAKSREEIDAVIEAGADLVMLPYWETVDEVKAFAGYVGSRAKKILLLETIGAEKCLDAVLEMDEVDEIHIGLNDLHIQYKNKFMFELLSNGKVEEICKKISKTGKPYGFGGIAQLDEGLLPARYIIGEHVRLGSSRVILSRSFTNFDLNSDKENAAKEFKESLNAIRKYEEEIRNKPDSFFEENRKKIAQIVKSTVAGIK